MYTLEYGESHNTNPAKHALQPFYSFDFKNKYVNANMNLYSSKIIANTSPKLSYEVKCSRF